MYALPFVLGYLYMSMYVCIAICVGLSFSSSHNQSFLKQLQAKLSNSPSMVIQVRRSDTLKDALQEVKKKTFAPDNRIKVF